MKKKNNPWGFEELMVLAAFRYCLGRQTYIVGCCVDWLIEQWPNFSDKTKALVEKELNDAFERDDIMRLDKITSPVYYPLGHDMDRYEWERVRNLYG